ncbi:hypothetical protein DICPUDRAFT_88309 [Dictyostelium purpureum]|uniref:Pyridine nucleotide-disulfide oxidoreductase domain-containing protein 1 n=1 Tax=Dictyostelium purpureum TaxID=5786 RepID=F0ZNL1_DICPU|nr:uncharacterized protein DICPUDRAFT_88309 [Dictyostelium purpureum]EGC34477.1 hypothetical protein DICPUDRAFT_88309 [Dictyostelium purpureum]|eukprot:XP_003289012.1 hypothetical protein DICPUDRAFT_88309 [Dictyostelium purpureum]
MVHLLIIGGGIAGLTCAESYSYLKPNDKVTILSCSPILKTVCNVQKISKVLESFDVFESKFTDVEFNSPNINVVVCDVDSVDVENKIVKTDKGGFSFDYLSICSGAKPNVIKSSNNFIGIRDTDSILDLKDRLENSKRILIVGNGGIALELVHEIKGCEIVWSIKDKHIGNAFFDKDASNFLFKSKQEQKEKQDSNDNDSEIMIKENNNTGTISNSSVYKNESGSALGPQWYSKYNFNQNQMVDSVNANLNIEYETIVTEIYDNDDSKESNNFINQQNFKNESEKKWPIYAKLNNGNVYGCDFIISATGVIPNSNVLLKNRKPSEHVALSKENALVVSEQMETSIKDIYAAGDVCSVEWNDSKVWFQMRLWSQARIMGRYAAQCIAKQSVKGTKDEDNLEEICTSFEFELFAHATKFFGFKVIMLGLYNGQGLDLSNQEQYQIYTREILGEQYVKVILENGKLIGSLLIGNTDLEETFENLILNHIDLSRYGPEILNPEIDIEDYFD